MAGIQLIDTATPAAGTLPASPLAGAFGQMVQGYGRSLPTAVDKADILYKQAATQKLQQEISSPQTLADVFNAVQNPNAGPPPLTGEGPLPDGSAPPAPVTPDSAALVRQNLPKLVQGLAAGGNTANIPALVRLFTATTPGIQFNSGDLNHPSPVTAAMVGAGENPLNTPEGLASGMTPGQRDRNAKITAIKAANPGVSDQDAANVADGVTEISTDQAGNRVRINKATGKTDLLYSPGANAANNFSNPGSGIVQQQPQPGTGAAPNAAPAYPGNNPFNLRPVGATTGFQGFPTLQAGMAAGVSDLASKLAGHSAAMGGLPPTLRNIVSVYSPPNENNTAALIKNASARMGIDPDAPLNLSHLGPLASAILTQEQGGAGTAGAATTANSGASPAQPGVPSAAAAPATFSMKPGDLGMDFTKLYGGAIGGAVQDRATHAVSSFFGNNTADPSLAAFGKLNALKNGLVSAESLMPGRSANTALAKNLMEAYPDTDSNLTGDEGETAMEQAAVNPADAETKFNQGIERAAGLRQQAYQALQNKFLDPKIRDNYQTVVNTIDKTLMSTLPGNKAAEYANYVGIPAPANNTPAPTAPQTNLQRGSNATSANGTVRVLLPDGKTTGTVKISDLPGLISDGGRVLQ